MKNFTLLFTAIILGLATMAQAPMGINYQTVIRDGDGNILPYTELSLQMTIHSGAPDGAVVYSEIHTATTNAFGLVNLVIGYGTPQNNAFSDINWGDGEKYLETAIDLTGGGTYTILGVTQFLSVPYAMHSQTTETFAETDPEFNAWDKSSGIAITENQITDLQDYLTEETDPEFNAWDKSTGIAITENQITDLQDYLTAETDPEFNAWDKSTGITITENQVSDLQDYLTEETDPEFNAWDKSSGIAITENQITDLQDYLTEETDPEFNAWDKSTGISITENQITDLQDYLTEEVDGDPTNELQTVAEDEYEVTLSQGGGTFMTGVKSYTQAEIDAMTPYNGLTVINTTTNCVNYYVVNNWFETCGICTPQPTQAIAGDDQAFYDDTIEATLAANTPEQGTGIWNIVSGEGGSFDDATLPETTFTGQPCTSYTLAWNITTSCGTSTDNAGVSFYATPTQAFAGNDTVVEGGDVSLYLSANTPEIGNGLWSVLSGDGGTFDDVTSPTTLFTGLPEISYTLQWKIYTVCDTTYDEVTTAFYTWYCGSPLTDSRDGKQYETVLIGEQCWMAENLNIGTRIDGVNDQTDDGTFEKYCYNNSDAQCDVYGGLYQWNEMMQYTTTAGMQGICMEGWHLPTDAEWTTLTNYVSSQPEYLCNGDTNYIAKALAATTLWNTYTGTCTVGNNLAANNATGFSCLPGGQRYSSGYHLRGMNGHWWSSTERDATVSGYFIVIFNAAYAFKQFSPKYAGHSVRCLRD